MNCGWTPQWTRWCRFKEDGGDAVGWVLRMDEGQTLADCAKRIKMAVKKKYFPPDEAETLADLEELKHR